MLHVFEDMSEPTVLTNAIYSKIVSDAFKKHCEAIQVQITTVFRPGL